MTAVNSAACMVDPETPFRTAAMRDFAILSIREVEYDTV